MKQDELQIIEHLTGFSPDQIKLADDGFNSRGYIIDDGRIVFKFKKSPEVSYKTEIKALNFVNSLNLGINTQKVGWVSPDDSYLGIYGVIGESLERTFYDPQNIGTQLGHFLQNLHAKTPETAEHMNLATEIRAWEERFNSEYTREFLHEHFSEDENHAIDALFYNLTQNLQKLGEKSVFSHGDLGDGNILVDKNGQIGIIDFSEMLYLDEAADFMDVSDDSLREYMLNTYGADNELREKVHLRVLIRPFFVLSGYIKRNDTTKIDRLAAKIREII